MARRVANFVPASKVGSPSAQPGTPSPRLGGLPGLAVAGPGRRSGPAIRPGRPRPGPPPGRRNRSTSSGIQKDSSGGSPKSCLGHLDLVGPERRAVRGRRVGQLRRGPPDVAAQDQQRGLGLGPVGRLGHGLTDGRLEAVDVVGHLTRDCERSSRTPRSAPARCRCRPTRWGRRS